MGRPWVVTRGFQYCFNSRKNKHKLSEIPELGGDLERSHRTLRAMVVNNLKIDALVHDKKKTQEKKSGIKWP